jgi:hypothetical protein|tara:strand:- start:8199 stop:8462 length:264 start_codon:yes stop_codon:yes gene_type:complete
MFFFKNNYNYIYRMEQQDTILKILGYKTWSDKRKIDALLELDVNMYTNLGSESTKTERSNVAKESRFIYRAIKSIDEKLGKELLRTQ